MYIEVNTLDDLLRSVFQKLLRSNTRIKPTKGPAKELTGVLLKINRPRSRLSRTEVKGTLFSCLGELLWYLAKTDDLAFIAYYINNYKKCSDDGKTVHGAYGPRMFRMRGGRFDQIANVVSLLRRKPYTRQAVIQLFDAADISKEHKDVPCTCTVQFMVRRKRLHVFTNMRSNDAFLGLPHDVFAFTMLQEIIARTLGVDVGTYSHAVGSLHLYKKNSEGARQYLREGWQATVPMPPMPFGDPWPSIRKVISAESAIRQGRTIRMDGLGLDNYWADIVRLLQVFSHSKRREGSKIAGLKAQMSVRLYDSYIEQKKKSAEKRAKP